jgi:hypothetical protein
MEEVGGRGTEEGATMELDNVAAAGAMVEVGTGTVGEDAWTAEVGLGGLVDDPVAGAVGCTVG